MAYTKIQELIIKHLSFEKTDLGFASVEYFAESGNISGELYRRIQAMLKEALAESSDESAALPLHDVSVNKGSEFLSVGVAVCPYFNECINNGKNEHCDLQTFQEIDCFIGQTER